MTGDQPVVPPISAIVLTQNEAKTIARCLESLDACVTEILVVDSGSTDETLRIAMEHGASVFEHPFANYAEQRNWAQSNLPLTNEWIFHVDADERVDSTLAAWLRGEFARIVVDKPQVTGFLVRRRIRFLNRDILHGGVYPTYHCRLFKRDAGWCEPRLYDQHFVVAGDLERAPGDLIEDNGSDVIAWCQKHLRWAELEARELRSARSYEAGVDTRAHRLRGRASGNPLERRRWLRESIYGKAPRLWRAWFYFGYRLFVRLGFLDGWRGIVYHLLHGLWFRLVVDTILMSGDDNNRDDNPAASTELSEEWRSSAAPDSHA